MQVENPTGDAGASINERLVNYLAAQESPAEPEPKTKQGATDEPEQRDLPGVAEPEPDANAAQDDDRPGSDEPDADQGPQLSTADLARVFGVDESTLDVDTDGNVLIKTKIDGKDGAAKFDDLIKAYQVQGHIDNQAREVAEQKKAMQQRMAQVDQVANDRIQHLESLINMADQELMGAYQSMDWQALRDTNPGEYAARKQDFEQRKAQLQQAYQTTLQERAQQAQQQQEMMAAYVSEQRQQLPTFIPEWKDSAVATKESAEIKEWATKNGFEAQELKGIVRSPHVAALRKAMLYDRLQQSKSVVENKVRTAPKLIKAGPPANTSREQQTVRNLKDNVRKTGGKDGSVAAYLLATGKV